MPAPVLGRSTLTGRAAVLAVVVAALVLSLALPLREYLAQRARIEELRSQGEQHRASIEELTAAAERWTDPAYVVAQARARLHFVMPGEVGYVVLGPEEAPAPGAASAQEQPRTWYSALWGSMERAARPAAKATTPAPAQASPGTTAKPTAPAAATPTPSATRS